MARQIALLFAAAFLAYGYNNIFMTLAPSFVVDIGGSLAEAGLQNSVYLAVAVLLRFFLGPAADRWGTKPVMLAGLAAFVIGGALFPLCGAFWQVVAVRCVQAIGLAAFWSSATATVSELAPPQARGRWLGLYRLVTSASLLVGPVVAFGLVKVVGFSACLWGLAGCAAVASACVGLMGQRRSGEAAPSCHACGECGTPGFGRCADASPGDSRGGALPLPDELDERSGRGNRILGRFPWLGGATISVVVGTFVAAMGYGLLFSFGNTFTSAAGAIENGGWYFTLIGIGGLLANPVAGALCDRMDAPRLLGAHMLLVGVGVALFSQVGAMLPILVLSGLCVGYGYAGAMVCAQAAIAHRVPSRHRATALALQQNAIDIGIACASGLYGLVFSVLGSSAAAPFLFQACAIAVCGVVLMISGVVSRRQV